MQKKSLLSLFTIALFFISLGVFSSCTKKDETIIQNDLVGYWQGVLYQETSTPNHKFPFMIKIDADGRSVYGRSEIRVDNSSEYFGIMDFSGEFKNNILKYKEGSIKSEKTGAWYWCIKEAELNYDKAKKRLSGLWETPGCNKGDIELYKLDVISKTEFCSGEEVYIEAEGKDLKWYSNDRLTNQLGAGNKFKPALNVSSTYYVTQTIDGIETIAIPVSIEVRNCGN